MNDLQKKESLFDQNSNLLDDEFYIIKHKLKQHFLLKESLPNLLEFNETLLPFNHLFLTNTVDKQSLIHFHLYKATYELLNWRCENANIHLKKIRPLLNEFDNPIYNMFYNNIKSGICYAFMDYDGAIEHSLKSLKHTKHFKDINIASAKYLVKIFGNLYTFYFQKNDYKQAFAYYKAAVVAAEKYKCLEDIVILISNFIIHSIGLKNFNQAKKAKALMDKIAFESTSDEVHIYQILAELDCTFHIGREIDKVEALLIKHQNQFNNSMNPFHHTSYLTYQIDVFIKKNKLEQAFELCKNLNTYIGDKPNHFTYNLLLYLSWLCVKDENYIDTISSSKEFKKFNINNKISRLLYLLQQESNNHSKGTQIWAYNFIIDYYQKKGAYKKAFKYASNCLNQLKEFSFENVHQEIAIIINQFEDTQKIEEQNDLISQQEKLTQYFREFAYTAAHDLKSPLLTIKKFAEIIKTSFNNTNIEQAQEYLDIIVETSERMSSFIKELIEKYSKEHYEQKIEIIDLDEVIKNIKQNLQVLIEGSNCEIICSYDQSKVVALQTPLEILFQNFISNAIKYRKLDEKPIIKINYTKDGVFSIEDNGVGIEKEMHQEIFKPFFKSNDRHIGSGIGLATCKKIINNFGGDVWVESELGKGSTFYFTLATKAPNTLEDLKI